MPLNPFQQKISDLARSLGLRGAAETNVYNTPQFQDLVNQHFGLIPLPAGITEDMVTSRSGSALSFTDPEGFIHNLVRNLNGVDPRLGQVTEASTNRPAVLPTPAPQQNALNELLPQLVNLFKNPVGLQSLDPNTLALLDQMKQAEDQALQQQFDRELGTLVAQLTGQGVGSSSIASDFLSRAKQGQGLVRSQAQGQQAQRQLGVQQFLTGATQQQNQDLQSFLQDLIGQGTQRDISGAQIGVQREGINKQNEQFFAGLQEQIRQFNEQLRMQERQNLLNNIFKGVAVAAAPFTGGLSLFSGLGGSGGFNFGKAGKPPSDLGYG